MLSRSNQAKAPSVRSLSPWLVRTDNCVHPFNSVRDIRVPVIPVLLFNFKPQNCLTDNVLPRRSEHAGAADIMMAMREALPTLASLLGF